MDALVPDLLGLWRGDEDSVGYECFKLAYEIAKRWAPSSLDALLNQLYPGVPESERPADGVATASFAYEKWAAERQRAFKSTIRKSAK